MRQIKFFLALIIFSQSALFSQSGWVQQYSGTSSKLIDSYFNNDQTGYICGEKGVILKTTNGGSFWYNVFNRPEFDVLSIYFINNIGWAVVRDNIIGDSCFIFKTINAGVSWQKFYKDSTKLFYRSADIEFLNNATGYVSASFKFYKSTNGGVNWFAPAELYFGIGLHFIDPLTGWVCRSPTKIYKTSNGGYNWIEQNLFSYHQYSLEINFVNSQTGFCISNNIYGVLYKTTTGGSNWYYGASPDNWYSSMDFVNSDTGYMIGMGFSSYVTDKFFKTTNSGENWTAYSLNFNKNLNKLAFTSINTGFIVGDSGIILKTTTGGIPIGIQQLGTNIPEEFSLFQNYPNPFNPVTKIKFDISGKSVAQTFLSVYDILGREVSVLVNQELKPGTYEVDFDGSGFTSGVYFYKLISVDYSETKRMVLIK